MLDIIRQEELHIKTTIPHRMATLTGTLIHCSLEGKLVRPLRKPALLFKTIKTELPLDPVLPLAIYLKECRLPPTEILAHLFITAPFKTVGKQIQPRCPSTGKGIKKLGSARSEEYYSLLKRKETRRLSHNRSRGHDVG